jgi:hypothetical protein
MSTLLVVRLVLGALGLLVFGYGVRIESSAVRWAGIGLIAVALALRFVKRQGAAQR